MKVYEIVNPSDAYTIEGEPAVVAAATLLLGEGHYGLSRCDGEKDAATGLPMFAFMPGADVDATFKGLFGQTLGAIIEGARPAIADALSSVLIGRFEDRETYRAGLELIDDPGKRVEWQRRWHEDRRTSLNNIGARAWAMAAHMRRALSAEASA